MRGMRLTGWVAFVLVASIPAALADSAVTITLKDHHFTPDSIAVPAGQRFRIELTNLDSTVSEFESYDMHFEKIVVGNGGKIHVFAGPLHPGQTYKFFDDYNPDSQGTITATTKKD
ncbi:MAG TPA: cupredoxin domain-containing protein [Acidisoma sp.]|uniref:cupredoxin domain-containing protein n=1 Tax=Acidisoma sp. TaxID=1872115 RepID=UPI002C4B4779|nr:cupredoxin domain-containing protein [Acidisoma sp.]HTI00082.1 cupredoxin domain-containing protein [Acidisoma sp.]